MGLMTLALAACAGTASPTSRGAALTGSWGGPHVGLALDAQGGRLDYDCAAGTIDGPITASPTGAFVASGQHAPGTGGPERIGDVRPSFPATYSGRVTGDRMVLRVRTEANGGFEATYTLSRGAPPQLFRCL